MPIKGKKRNTIIGLLFVGAFIFGIFISTFIYKTKSLDTRADTLALASKTIDDISDTKENLPLGTDLLGRAELSYAGGTEGRNKNIEIIKDLFISNSKLSNIKLSNISKTCYLLRMVHIIYKKKHVMKMFYML